MEVFEELPKLTSLTVKEIPAYIHFQLNYLWKAAHLTVKNSRAFSHTFALEFIALTKQHDIVLPEDIKCKLCSQCCALLLPTITCRIRVAKAKWRRKRDEMQYKNQLEIECLQCKFKNSGPKLYEKTKKKVDSIPATTEAVIAAVASKSPGLNSVASKSSSIRSTTAGAGSKKSSHSFLGLFDKSKNISAPKGHLLSSLDGNFVPLSSSSTPNGRPSGGGKRKVDLLELERSNKKIKRASLGAASPTPQVALSPSMVGTRLGLAAAKERLSFLQQQFGGKK